MSRAGSHGSAGLAASLGSVLAVAGACADVDRFPVTLPDLPPDVDWAAAITSDGEGTGFVQRSGDRFELFFADAEPTGPLWLLGYQAASFDAMSPPVDEAALRRAHLSFASSSQSLLAPADYLATGRWQDGKLQLAEAPIAEQPTLTASWLAPCPSLIPPEGSSLATTCLVRSCTARAHQLGCQLSFEASGCPFETLSGSLGPRGELRLESTPALGTCATPLESPPHVITSARCGPSSCSAHLVRPAPLRLRAITRTLYPVLPVEPPLPSHMGYLTALSLPGDPAAPTLAVGSHLGRVKNRYCGASSGSAVLLVDRTTLAVTATVSGFSCMSELAPDPRGGGFFAATSDRGTRVLRLDLQGGVTQAVDLSSPTTSTRSFARSIAVSADLDRVAVLYSDDERLDPTAEIRLFDLSLNELRPITGIAGDAQDISLGTSGVLVAIGAGGLARYDLRTGQPSAAFDLTRQCGTASHLFFVGQDPVDPDRSFVSARDREDGADYSALFLVSLRDGRCSKATFYEGDGMFSDVVPWPADPRLLLAGVDAAAEDRAGVVLVDHESAIVLPGLLELGGRRIVWPLVADAPRRVVYALLPQDAIIARIEAQDR
ncbi:MAG: hypothetical protein IT384_14355 [Deltaproteobacteria bacterium]|nr:hypothetical protein [Deltaproteobacteria bacterium]